MINKEERDKVLAMSSINEGKIDRLALTFINTNIFITGGTGFVGKVLVEKILRCCPKLRRIYLLVRPKKGKNAQERLEEIFKGPLYEKLRQLKGDSIFDKVTAIPGDCMLPEMGISDEDRKKITEEVHVIYHCAATIRFDDPLRKTVLLNVRGTKYALNLAKECKVLHCFLYLSTAYCHLNEKILYEKPYPPPSNPYLMIKLCEMLDEETISSIQAQILKEYPNGYAFSKALAEGLVCDEMENLPTAVIRPSVIIPIWLDPLPGWIDNINGPTGLLIGAGKGVIRSMYIDPTGIADFVPVDIAVNAMLIATCDRIYVGTRKVYNMTTSGEYQVSWAEIIELGREIVETKMPLNWVMWYPGGSMKTSRWQHYVCAVLFHYIPAIFLDGLIMLTGNKPILWKIHRRISKGFDVFDYYVNRKWQFDNEASISQRHLLSNYEKQLYKIDGLGLDMKQYFLDCIHCARLYILKESDESLPTARRHMMVMYFVDKLCKTMIILGAIYLFLKHIIYPIFGLQW